MKIHILYLTVLLLLFKTSFLFSQDDNVVISGYVKDAVSGEALIGTNILLYKDSINTNNPPFRGTSTNRYGYYAIPKISKGIYIIVIRNIAYKTLVDNLEVTITTGSLRYNANLNTQELELDEIVVEGKHTDIVSISTIDISPGLLEQLPSLSGEVDVLKSLQLLPGVQVASEISSGLYVRGGSPDQTLTLLDGVIIYNPSHLGNIASTFNTSALSDIRFIKGAFPAEYGGRLSSVLDLKLRSGTKEKVKCTLGLGTLNSYATLEGPMTDNATFMLSGRSLYYDKIQDIIQKESQIPRYNFYDFNSKLDYTISENDELTISGSYSKDNLYNPPEIADIEYDIGWKNLTLSLNWQQIHSESYFSNTSFSFINYEYSSILNDKSTSLKANDYYSSSILYDLVFKRTTDFFINELHTIKTGIDIVLHSYDLIYSDFYDELLRSDNRVGTKTIAFESALFIQDEWDILPNLKTNIGGRFYYFKDRKYFRFEPRISASFGLTDDISLKGAFAIAHQFLHLIVRNDITLPTDLWYPSTSKIKPAQSSQYVLGLETMLFEKAYFLSIEGYYKKLNNLYEFKPFTNISLEEPIEEQLTIGEGEAYGIEFFINKRIGDISGWLGYTYSFTNRQFDELNGGELFYPRYDRRHDLSLVATYQLNKDWDIGITWTYATGQGFTIPTGQYQFEGIGVVTPTNIQFNYSGRNEHRLTAYHKLDVHVNYRFTWFDLPFKIYLNVYNVYNRKNTFSQYITYEYKPSSIHPDLGGSKIPKLNQLTLFPFIPTIGINVTF